MDPTGFDVVSHVFTYQSVKPMLRCVLCGKAIGKKKMKSAAAFKCVNRGCASVLHALCRQRLKDLEELNTDTSSAAIPACTGEFSLDAKPISYGLDDAIVELMRTPDLSSSAGGTMDTRKLSVSEFISPLFECYESRGGADGDDDGASYSPVKAATPLHEAAMEGRLQEVDRLLGGPSSLSSSSSAVRFSTDLNARLVDGSTPLICAVRSGHVDVVKSLLAHRAVVNHCLSDGSSALLIASSNGDEEMVRLLLRARAEVHLSRNRGLNPDGHFPLFAAIDNGHEEVVNTLLKARASAFQQAKDGQTSLHIACHKGLDEVVKSILLHTRVKASCLAAKDTLGNTALHAAASSGRCECVRLLLVHGAIANRNAAGALPSEVVLSSPHRWWSSEDRADLFDRVLHLLSVKNPMFELRTDSEKRMYISPSRRSLAVFDHAELRSVFKDHHALLQGVREAHAAPIDQDVRDAWKEKPATAVKVLQERGIVGPEPTDVGQALYMALGNGQLDRYVAGDYMGHEKHHEVLEQFCNCFNWQLFDVDFALRDLLFHFRLPGEAQQIDRVVQTFSTRYHQCNPHGVLDTDVAYILSFSIIMLNTDAHNPMVQKKMTKVQFLDNHKSVFSRKQKELKEMGLPEIPEADWVYLLGHLYDRIVACPLAFVSPSGECNMTTKGVMKATWVRYAEPPEHTKGYTHRRSRSKSKLMKGGKLTRPVWQKSRKWITLCHMGASEVGSYSLIIYEDIQQLCAQRIIPLVDVKVRAFTGVRKDVGENRLDGWSLVRLHVNPILEDHIDETAAGANKADGKSRMFFLAFQTNNERQEWMAALKLYNSASTSTDEAPKRLSLTTAATSSISKSISMAEARPQVTQVASGGGEASVSDSSPTIDLPSASQSLPEDIPSAFRNSAPASARNASGGGGGGGGGVDNDDGDGGAQGRSEDADVPFPGIPHHDGLRQSMPRSSKAKFGTLPSARRRPSSDRSHAHELARAAAICATRKPAGTPPPIPQRRDKAMGSASRVAAKRGQSSIFIGSRSVQTPPRTKPPAIPPKPARAKSPRLAPKPRSAENIITRSVGDVTTSPTSNSHHSDREASGASQHPIEEDHEDEESPGGASFLAPPPDISVDRPQCPEGSACKSQDPTHWMDYQHTPSVDATRMRSDDGKHRDGDELHVAASPATTCVEVVPQEEEEEDVEARDAPPAKRDYYSQSFLQSLAESVLEKESVGHECAPAAAMDRHESVPEAAAVETTTADGEEPRPLPHASTPGTMSDDDGHHAPSHRIEVVNRCISATKTLVSQLIEHPQSSPEALNGFVVRVGVLGKDAICILREEDAAYYGKLCDLSVETLKHVVVRAKAYGASQSPQDQRMLAQAIQAWMKCLARMKMRRMDE